MVVKRNIPHGSFRSPKEKPSLPAAFNNECAFSKRKRFENDDAIIKRIHTSTTKRKKRKREASLCRDKVKRKRERAREKKNRLLLLHRFSAVKIIYYYYDTYLYKIKDIIRKTCRLSFFIPSQKIVIFFLPDILLVR